MSTEGENSSYFDNYTTEDLYKSSMILTNNGILIPKIPLHEYDHY
jgi:hypothetical protein